VLGYLSSLTDFKKREGAVANGEYHHGCWQGAMDVQNARHTEIERARARRGSGAHQDVKNGIQNNPLFLRNEATQMMNLKGNALERTRNEATDSQPSAGQSNGRRDCL
jgi:hypothetical protein